MNYYHNHEFNIVLNVKIKIIMMALRAGESGVRVMESESVVGVVELRGGVVESVVFRRSRRRRSVLRWSRSPYLGIESESGNPLLLKII